MKRRRKAFREVASSSYKTDPLDYVTAMNNATTSRPANSDLSGMDLRPLLAQREVFSEMNLAHLPANHAFARTPKVDPMSRG